MVEKNNLLHYFLNFIFVNLFFSGENMLPRFHLVTHGVYCVLLHEILP